MSRYYFDIENGGREPDSEGVELDDADCARTMAVRTAGQILQDRAPKFWSNPKLLLTVRDERGGTLCRLRVTGASEEE